ncbi:MAG: tetratricopeptide (TPR) repeat protein [Phycisphaerales bacterium]|jgi:tetratricopeptide (TPR) repeat protein
MPHLPPNDRPSMADKLLRSAGSAPVPRGTTPELSKRARAIPEIRQALSENANAQVVKLITALPPKLQKDPEVLYLHALVMERLGKRPEACRLAERSVAMHPSLECLMILARCSRAAGQTDPALRWCDQAETLAPGNETVAYIRSGVLEEAGRFDEATAVLAPIAASYEGRGDQMPMGLRLEWSKLLVQRKDFDAAIELIDTTVGAPELPPAARSQQLYLKAKALDRKKAYVESWGAAESANEIGQLEFDPELYEEQVSVLMENWSAERMERFPISACESELPVFIAGMPRSGTSLIDQIIDAHPKASGVGELNTVEQFAMQLGAVYDAELEPPACFGKMDAGKWTRAARDYVRQLEKLAEPGVERVVNKALGNNKLVGMIARLFPRTRIIHAIRDPRDVGISCFMGGFNNRMHPWTTRLDWAANAWGQSSRMMQHWKDTLDVPILEVRYEELVRDPETQFPRIIEFLGLEWDEACREFYKSQRTVRTLSYDQVNRPIYTSSAGRHVNYAECIEGVEFPAY